MNGQDGGPRPFVMGTTLTCGFAESTTVTHSPSLSEAVPAQRRVGHTGLGAVPSTSLSQVLYAIKKNIYGLGPEYPLYLPAVAGNVVVVVVVVVTMRPKRSLVHE
jgi:hypothetical protein